MKKIHKQKLERLATAEISMLADNLFLQDGNEYILFGKYLVIKEDAGVKVTYNNDYVGVFTGTSTAASWCVADKYKQYRLADRILQLDADLFRQKNNMQARRIMAKQSNNFEFWNMIQIKLDRRVEQIKSIETELTKCVKLAKYWQYRGFNNEAERTGRNPTI
jgi:hypothetical protein